MSSAGVDSDGLLDLYFVSQLGTSELWRNLGDGRFENITARSGLTMSDAIAVGASFADIDNDGDRDLFVTTTRHGNDGGKHFRDETATYFPRRPWGSMGAKSFDFNGDGRLDLFVTDMHRHVLGYLAAERGGRSAKLGCAHHARGVLPAREDSVRVRERVLHEARRAGGKYRAAVSGSVGQHLARRWTGRGARAWAI